MARFAFLLFVVLNLTDCTLSVTDTRSNGRGSLIPHVARVQMAMDRAVSVPVVEHRDVIDLTSTLHSALAIPQRLESLKNALIASSIVLGGIGVANAALLTRLLLVKTRVPSPLPAPVTGPVVACACGAKISTRTKTGRCRRCALDHRTHARAIQAGVGVTRDRVIRHAERFGKVSDGSRGDSRRPSYGAM